MSAGGPVRSSVRRRPATILASELHHRTVLHLRLLLPGSSSLPGPAALLGYRRNITTPLPNVYSGQHRFSCVRHGGNQHRTVRLPGQTGSAAAAADRAYALNHQPEQARQALTAVDTLMDRLPESERSDTWLTYGEQKHHVHLSHAFTTLGDTRLARPPPRPGPVRGDPRPAPPRARRTRVARRPGA